MMRLSPLQEDMWFSEQVLSGGPMYNIVRAYRIEGPLDVAIFDASIRLLHETHEALRLTVSMEDGAPALSFDKRPDRPTPLLDVTHYPTPLAEEIWKDRLQQLLNKSFSLQDGQSSCYELVRVDANTFMFGWGFHHLAIDAVGLDLLVADLAIAYEALSKDSRVTLDTEELPFSIWLQDLRRKNDLPAARARAQAWAAKIRSWTNGEIPQMNLATDFERPAQASGEGGFIRQLLPPGVFEAAQNFAAVERASPFVVFASLIALLLRRFSGQDQIVLGVPFSGRMDPAVAKMVGLCINMQPLPFSDLDALTFRELVSRTRGRVLDAMEFQDVPLSSLMDQLDYESGGGRSPLFQVLFTHVGRLDSISLGRAIAHPVRVESCRAKFELSFTLDEIDAEPSLTAEFRHDLFQAGTVAAMLAHAVDLLGAVLAKPDLALGAVGVPSAELDKAPAASPASSPSAATIHSLVMAVAEETPDAIALEMGDAKMSYGELVRRAEHLAHVLRLKGVLEGDVVGLLFDQGFDVIVGMLGVAMRGAAYLPLDPTDPPPRLAMCVQDAQPRLMLTSARHADLALSCTPNVEIYDPEPVGPMHRCPTVNVGSGHWLNVLYTSGSTGRPKGVALTHRGILRLVTDGSFVSVDRQDAMVQLSPLNFDGATFEIWGSLTRGARLAIVEKSTVLAPKELASELRTRGVTVLLLTTPLLNRLIEDAPEALERLRLVVFGGEIISKRHIQEAMKHCGPGVLLHTYGPTENSFTSFSWSITAVDPRASTIPIGHPVPGTGAYLLDERLDPVPVGAIGELYLAGDGLADGYINDPRKTAELFLPNPFGPGRVYRTGDRARWNANGQLEFIGRTDNQLKIRSQRVELGEVEAAMRRHAIVAECFVTALAQQDGGRVLVGYFVPPNPPPSMGSPIIDVGTAAISELRDSLKAALPSYMVPLHLVALERLPLNPNGKVNRKLLPHPGDTMVRQTQFAPETDTERAVEQVWKDVLGVEHIASDVSFFDAGGHSLALVKLQSGLRDLLGVQFPLVDLFKFTTIKSIASEADIRLGHRVASSQSGGGPAIFVPSGVDAIAITGMSIRAPMASDVASYWSNILAGRDCIHRFPLEAASEVARQRYASANENWVRAVGVIDDPFHFDPSFFGIGEREAMRTDPQQRLFLECVWEALEDGATPEAGNGARVSIFAGCAPGTFRKADTSDGADGLAEAVGTSSAFIATRTAFKLGLQGEAVVVESLCSTSLLAVHMACAALLRGESDYAIAGGADIHFPQDDGYLYEPHYILSPDGYCRPFDERGAGTVPSSGVGAILLRRLSDAVRDGDPIHAVIRASAANNDGRRKVGYYAPSIEGQVEVISSALRKAGLKASDLSYIEAHGTATSLGDPIEISALSEVFQKNSPGTPKGRVGIGSVKGNVGHMGVMAGLGGLIKAVLSIREKTLAPSIHFERPNPHIDFANSPFFVVDRQMPWASSLPRRAGVSSYGIGGTNVHVVVEEHS